MKIKIGRNNSMTIMLSIIISLSIFAHLMKYLTEQDARISVYNYRCWMIFAVYLLFCILSDIHRQSNYSINYNLRWLIVFCVLLISSYISIMYGRKMITNVENNIKACICFLICFFMTVCVKWNKKITDKGNVFLSKLVVLLGIIAVIYALIMQGGNIINVIMNVNSYISAWNFFSFFGQRNVYAGFCFFCIIVSVFVYGKTNKKRFLWSVLIFVFQIMITGSRTAMLSTAIFTLVYYCLVTENKNNLILFGLGAGNILIIILNVGLLDSFMPTIHMTSLGIDSSEIRIMMWMSGFQKLIQSNALIFGFGEGSIETFLYPLYGYSSFHNSFIDILFQGGLVRLFIYVGASVYFYKNIRKSKDRAFRNAFTAGFIAYNVYCLTEAGAMMFELNYFSVLTTVMFAIMPMAYDSINTSYYLNE